MDKLKDIDMKEITQEYLSQRILNSVINESDH